MREVFVDTSFFVAILNPKDRLRQRAERTARSLGDALASWRTGVRSAVFPAGTWCMRVLHAACVDDVPLWA
jgi:predicted nucleic acid-binding protein